jgi:hypothetical protein
MRPVTKAHTVTSSKSARLGPVALQILGYLSTHPNAQDTAEGIAEWWLMEQRVRCRVREVKRALVELVAEGVVVERTARDGRVHYRLKPRERKTMARRIGGTPDEPFEVRFAATQRRAAVRQPGGGIEERSRRFPSRRARARRDAVSSTDTLWVERSLVQRQHPQ